MQHDHSSRVFLVVDRSFGNQLVDLCLQGAVWVIASQANRAVAESIWKDTPHHSLTLFEAPDGFSSHELVMEELETIRLHHPHLIYLDVLGAPLTEPLGNAITESGFAGVRPIGNGFRAIVSLVQ